jgi:alanyl-tRNA synthetase
MLIFLFRSRIIYNGKRDIERRVTMNEKLYYTDAYIQSFTSEIVKQDEDQNGTYAVLKETAFYPTGGGQPHDTGNLNGIEVTNVEEVDGEIRHYIEQPLASTEVKGQINWQRRFDHMQQHTGQHILSAAFADHFGIPTVAFHLGRDTVTIDLETPELSEKTAAGAEQLANEIVFQNRPITIRWVDKEEANTMPLRKALTVTENIRVVIVEDFDYNGCGGTHPKLTGEVGPIKILGWERHKGNIRLSFACGWRTLRLMHEKQTVLRDAVRLLNSKESDLPNKIAQLLDAQKETEKVLKDANDKLLSYEAKELLAQAQPLSHGKLVAAVFTDRSMQDLAKLASVLTENSESAVLLVTQSSGNIQCVCARGKAVDINMNDVLKNALPLIEGKGGGNPMSARGGGKAVISAQEFLQKLVDSVTK